MLGQVSLFAKLTIPVAIVAFGLAAAYVFRPTEQKLVLMRPVSLATILGPEFAAPGSEMFGPDQFHPSPTGYRACAAAMLLVGLSLALGAFLDFLAKDIAALERQLADAQRQVAAKVHMPEGYRVVWGGEYEEYTASRKQLAVVLPLTLVLIFVLLFGLYGNIAFPFITVVGVILSAPIGGLLALPAVRLRAPVLRVTNEDVPLPYAANLEKLALIKVADVVEAVKAVTYR